MLKKSNAYRSLQKGFNYLCALISRSNSIDSIRKMEVTKNQELATLEQAQELGLRPEEFNHWIGVGDLMREEAREQINTHFEEFAEWMRVQQNIEPELVIREGEPIPEIISQVTEDPEVGVLVLGAGTGSDGPGPLVSALTRMASSIPVPVTIISGDMTEERLKAVS